MKEIGNVVINNRPPNLDIIGWADGRALRAARDISNQTLNPQDDWKVFNRDVPFDWGNPPDPGIWWADELFPIHYRPKQGSAASQISFWDEGSGFIIYSEAQHDFWVPFAYACQAKPNCVIQIPTPSP
jgi:hypothetical protein